MAWAQSSWVVTPGEGVGAINLGITTTAAETVLNVSERIGAKNNPKFVRYGDEILIEYSSNQAVMISLHKNTFNTRNGPVTWVPYKGAAIGVAWNNVVSQLPYDKISRQLKTASGHPEEFYHAYMNLGLGFRVKGGVIDQVDVWNAK